jgi:hypothetical protein
VADYVAKLKLRVDKLLLATSALVKHSAHTAAGLALFTPRYFAVKTHSTDDSRYGPCNQSDTRECQPYRAGVLMQFAAVVGDLDEAEAKATAGAYHLLTIAHSVHKSSTRGNSAVFISHYH